MRPPLPASVQITNPLLIRYKVAHLKNLPHLFCRPINNLKEFHMLKKKYQVSIIFLTLLLAASSGYAVYLASVLRAQNETLTGEKAALTKLLERNAELEHINKSDEEEINGAGVEYAKLKDSQGTLQAQLKAFSVQAYACERLRKHI